jgi:hypothetical protein
MVKTPVKRFIIEDETHSEQMSEHGSLEAAQLELARLEALPWDKQPNLAPCGSWETCGRNYVLIEGENIGDEWRQISRTPMFDISAKGILRHHR